MNLFFNTEQNRIRLPYRFLILFLLILSYLFLWVGFLTLGLMLVGLIIGVFSMANLPTQLEQLLQSSNWVDLILAIVLFLSVHQSIVFCRRRLDKQEPIAMPFHSNWQSFLIGLASIFILLAFAFSLDSFHLYSIQFIDRKQQTLDNIENYFILVVSNVFIISARQFLYWGYIFINLKQMKYGLILTVFLLSFLDSYHQPCFIFYAIWSNLLLAGFHTLSGKIGFAIGIGSAWYLFFDLLFSFPILKNSNALFRLTIQTNDPLALANRLPTCSYLPVVYLFFLSILFLLILHKKIRKPCP